MSEPTVTEILESHSAAYLRRVVNWIRGAGIVLCLIPAIVVAVFFATNGSRSGVRGAMEAMLIIVAVAMTFVPGSIYLILAHFIVIRRPWAVYTAEAITWLQIMLVAIPFVLALPGWKYSWPITLAFGLWLAALYRISSLLHSAVGAIEHLPHSPQRGFELLPKTLYQVATTQAYHPSDNDLEK